jgi:uncharacterized protein (DUF1330 family)
MIDKHARSFRALTSQHNTFMRLTTIKGTVMSKGYCIVMFQSVSDQTKVDAYRRLAAPVISAGGGTFLVGALPARTYEQGRKERAVIVEFENIEKAIAVRESPAYQAALEALGDGAVRDVRVVEGL